VEVSALRYSPGSLGLHGKTPLLRLQSDERLIVFIRRGNHNAFEVLFSRYQSRLLAFCRHLLACKEDAEDVLQEVMAAAFNAILADDRPINVRPWLYRIARNRSLNHLRRAHAIGVDSMDIHLSENGATTADKVHERERFRLLVGDIHGLPETQRTALVLREMDALSYEQIAEAMETTVPGVKSLLVRARIALAEAAEARQLSCEDVRLELGEVAEGIRKKPDALARRHLRSCTRCSTFHGQLKKTNKALAALLPIGPLAALKHLALFHIGHSAGTGSGAAGTTAGATGAGAGATGAGATGAGATAGVTSAGATGAAGASAGAAGVGAGAAGASAGAAGASVIGSAGSALSAGAGALAGKAAAGLAAAAIVTAGAVEATHGVRQHRRMDAGAPVATVHSHAPGALPIDRPAATTRSKKASKHDATAAAAKGHSKNQQLKPAKGTKATATATTTKPTADKTATPGATTTAKPADPGRSQNQTDPTVLTGQPGGSDTGTASASGSPDSSSGSTSTAGSPPPSSGGTTTSSGSTDTTSGSDSGTAGSGTTGPSGPTGQDGSTSSADSGSSSPSGTTGPAGADPLSVGVAVVDDSAPAATG
jgi:RNA polymerase sigma factor (sigma-70 family)